METDDQSKTDEKVLQRKFRGFLKEGRRKKYRLLLILETKCRSDTAKILTQMKP